MRACVRVSFGDGPCLSGVFVGWGVRRVGGCVLQCALMSLCACACVCMYLHVWMCERVCVRVLCVCPCVCLHVSGCVCIGMRGCVCVCVLTLS